MILTPETRHQLLAQAVTEAPKEACGLLLGDDGVVTAVHQLPNTEDRLNRYNIDPMDLLSALTDAQEQGLGVMAVYHSHSDGKAYPSATDVRLAPASWPDVLQVIVSLSDEEKIRAYRIEGEAVTEVPLST